MLCILSATSEHLATKSHNLTAKKWKKLLVCTLVCWSRDQLDIIETNRAKNEKKHGVFVERLSVSFLGMFRNGLKYATIFLISFVHLLMHNIKASQNLDSCFFWVFFFFKFIKSMPFWLAWRSTSKEILQGRPPLK